MMRTSIVIATAVLASLAACNKPRTGATTATATPTTPSLFGQMPKRKDGLWIQTITRDGKPGPMNEVRICLDAATDAKMSIIGHTMGGVGANSPCQSTGSRGLDGSYHFTSTCTFSKDSVVVTKGTASGDFSSDYKVHTETDMTGTSFGAALGHHVTDMEGRYAGACPADMAAGDMLIGRGLKFNVNRFPGAAGVFAGH